MKLKYHFVTQKIGQDYMAIAIGEDAAKFPGMIKLNSSARAVFEKLHNEISEEDLIQQLLAEYKLVDRDKLRVILDQLKSAGLLEQGQEKS